jgi:hypothetical protein
VPSSEIASDVETSRGHSIFHKDLLAVVYVTGDMAGQTDSSLYCLFEISAEMTEDKMPLASDSVATRQVL